MAAAKWPIELASCAGQRGEGKPFHHNRLAIQTSARSRSTRPREIDITLGASPPSTRFVAASRHSVRSVRVSVPPYPNSAIFVRNNKSLVLFI